MSKVSHVCAVVLALSLLASACAETASSIDDSGAPPAPSRELRDVEGAQSDAPEALASVDDESAGGATSNNDSESQSNPPTNDTPSDDDSDADPSRPDAADVDDRPEIERELDGLIAFVENARGHSFTSRPQVALLSSSDFDASFTERTARDAEKYATDFENFTEIYQAVGIIDTDQTLEEIWKLFGSAGVLGFYDPTDQQIVLRSGEITPFTRVVLVHELVHALDDQIFDLSRPEYDDRTDEIDWAFSAIAEGNANVIEELYRESLSTADQDAANVEEQNQPRSVSLSIFTNSFLELQFSRYEHGEVLMADLWSLGVDQVDAAFTSPPASSEAVIDAQQYLSGTAEDGQITSPPADGSVFETGTWGQVGWAALFTDVSPDLASAADGWGGDSFVAWRSGDQTCVRAHIEADTPDDLDRYAEVLEAWAQAGNREIFYPTADLIRVTACG